MSNVLSNYSKNAGATESKEKRGKFLNINIHRCPQNHYCPAVKVCPVDALSQDGYKAPTVDVAECIKCGQCVETCPTGALNFI
jgi:formate hydrogenlyase subunit 6/NADH:ubiquinone oxidoreductase subunit I